MDWYVADKAYIRYLEQFDSKVGYVDYGDKLKLHLGILLVLEEIKYYVPISSCKPKHRTIYTYYKKKRRLLMVWKKY